MDDGDAEAASAPADPNQSESFKRRESESFQRQWHWRQEGEEIGFAQRDLKGEDRVVSSRCTIGGEEVLLIAVFDGHGGAAAADFAQTELLPSIVDACADDPGVLPLALASAAAFDLVHRELLETAGLMAGTTATVCAYNAARAELLCANVGDSAALLVWSDGHMVLSENHRLEDSAEERARVVHEGARIERARTAKGQEVGPRRAWPGGLAVARTLGDSDAGSYVLPQPALQAVTLPIGGAAVVICSDGVWDAVGVGDAAHMLQFGAYANAAEAAEMLVTKSIESRGLRDDASCVVLLPAGGGRPRGLEKESRDLGGLRGGMKLRTGSGSGTASPTSLRSASPPPGGDGPSSEKRRGSLFGRRRSTSKDSMASDGSGSSKTGASRKLSVVGGLLGGGSRGRSPTSSGQVSPKSSEAGSSSPGHERPPALHLAPAVTASLERQPSGEGGGTDLSQPPWPTSLRSQQGRPSPSPAGSLPGSQPGSQYGGSVGGVSHYSHLPSPCSSVHTSVHGGHAFSPTSSVGGSLQGGGAWTAHQSDAANAAAILLAEGHGEAKSLSIPVRLDAMDQTSSGPDRDLLRADRGGGGGMGQAISIPVNLNRMGSDGGGGASSPKGGRGRAGSDSPTNPIPQRGRARSREEQRIAAGEAYAATASRGRSSPGHGRNSPRRVTPPEDDPRFKLVVEGDDPDSFENRQQFLLQRKASPGGSPTVKRHEFPEGGGDGDGAPPNLSVISEPLSLEMSGQRSPKGGSTGAGSSLRDSGAAGGGDSSTSSPLSGSVPGTAAHPSPMPQPTSGSASFYKSPVSSPSGGAGSSSAAAADGDGNVHRTHSPERHRLTIQGPKTIALPELPKRREEDKNAEIRPNAELRVVDWDDLMTATGPKGVKFLGQGEYAVAFAVNLPARAKDQCGSPAEARAESFRRFANAEGNSTPGRVRRAPPRAGETATAAGFVDRQTSAEGVLAAAAAGSAPPGAPPPDVSNDRFAPMPADLAAKGPTRSDLGVAGLSLEGSSSGQGLPPAITERFTPPLPDGTPGSSRLRPPHASSSGNSQEPSQEDDSSPDPSPEQSGVPMRRDRSFDGEADGAVRLRRRSGEDEGAGIAPSTKPYRSGFDLSPTQARPATARADLERVPAMPLGGSHVVAVPTPNSPYAAAAGSTMSRPSSALGNSPALATGSFSAGQRLQRRSSRQFAESLRVGIPREVEEGGPVAVKILKQDKREDPRAVAGLKREIRLMSTMRHSNVLQCLAVGAHQMMPFMVMQKLAYTLAADLPGPSETTPFWRRRSQCKKWPLTRALSCGEQLASALRFCHDEAFPGYRVLHRDVKPNNIGFLVGSGRLVLFDFGLASIWKRDPGGGRDKSMDEPNEVRPLTGQTGSLRYMAPEVAMCQPYNHKAEVFSFADVLWEMGSHERPFRDLSTDTFTMGIQKGVRPKCPKKWPPALTQLLGECWLGEPEKRPEMKDIIPRLREVLAGLEVESGAKAGRRSSQPGMSTSPP